MKFKSKVDWWLVVLVLLPGAAFIGIAVNTASSYNSEAVNTALMILLAVVLGIYLLLFIFLWPCEYTLLDDHLLIRSGVIKRKIHFRDISSVTPVWNLRMSSALSASRVMIMFHGKGRALISPNDREIFMDEIENRTEIGVGNASKNYIS